VPSGGDVPGLGEVGSDVAVPVERRHRVVEDPAQQCLLVAEMAWASRQPGSAEMDIRNVPPWTGPLAEVAFEPAAADPGWLAQDASAAARMAAETPASVD